MGLQGQPDLLVRLIPPALLDLILHWVQGLRLDLVILLGQTVRLVPLALSVRPDPVVHLDPPVQQVRQLVLVVQPVLPVPLGRVVPSDHEILPARQILSVHLHPWGPSVL